MPNAYDCTIVVEIPYGSLWLRTIREEEANEEYKKKTTEQETKEEGGAKPVFHRNEFHCRIVRFSRQTGRCKRNINRVPVRDFTSRRNEADR